MGDIYFPRYLIVDLEGTCCNDESLPDNERETIEIGAVITTADSLMAGEVFEEGRTFEGFVKPVRHPILTDFCIELTGIQQSEVDGADEFPEVFSTFVDWIGPRDGLLFCSWGPYDKRQFKRDCRYHGIAHPFENHLDVSRMFTKQTGRRRGRRGALKYFGLKSKGINHRGLSDAFDVVVLLRELLKRN